jgi:FtsZ-binding cell division protein ZapB
MTSLLFLAWVIVLKMQVQELREEAQRLAKELDRYIKKAQRDVDVSKEEHTWGKKPGWMTAD